MTRNKRIGIASLTLIPPFLLVINFIDILGLSIVAWAFALLANLQCLHANARL